MSDGPKQPPGGRQHNLKPGERPQETDNKPTTPLQTPRFAHSEVLSQDQTQVVRNCLQRVPLLQVLNAPEPTVSGTPGFTGRRKAPFDHFAPLTLQSFAVVPPVPVSLRTSEIPGQENPEGVPSHSPVSARRQAGATLGIPQPQHHKTPKGFHTPRWLDVEPRWGSKPRGGIANPA